MKVDAEHESKELTYYLFVFFYLFKSLVDRMADDTCPVIHQ